MKKLLALVTAAAFVCCLSGTAVLAKPGSDPAEPSGKSQPVTARNDAPANEKLRGDVLRMVSDAKAGKFRTPKPQFPQPTHRNNLSKGAKIAIGVSVAAVIVFAILWHTKGPGSD